MDTTSWQDTGKPPHLACIDALRGLAAVAVIGFHAFLFAPFANELAAVVRQGHLGVQLFYVISAFTLFLSLAARSKNEDAPIRNFFIRRFFRIVPLFYCAMIFYLLWEGLGPRYWLGDAPGITPRNIMATAVFLNGFYPYWINSIVPVEWSVVVEMNFYLLVPFLFRRINSLFRAAVFTFVTFLAALALHTFGQSVPLITDRVLWERFLYMWLPNQLPVFGLGMVLFFLCRDLDARRLEPRERKGTGRLLLAISLYAGVAFSFGYYAMLPPYFLYAMVFVVLAVALYLHPSRLLVNPATIYFGRISYSAYLVHFPLLSLAKPLSDQVMDRLVSHLPPTPFTTLLATLHFLIMFLIALVLTLLVAMVTYHLIERPGQALGRGLIRRLECGPALAPV